MDVVHEGDGAVVAEACAEVGNSGLEVLLGVELPVLGVNVGVDDLVADGAKRGEGGVVVVKVRRAHVRGDLADDLEQGLLETEHLGADLRVGQLGKVGVVPAAVLC